MTFKAAIFDMDGTLTDSMHIWDTAGITYLKSKGITPAPDLRERSRALSLDQVIDLYRQEYGIQDSRTQILADFDAIVEAEYQKVPLKSGVLELLQLLSQHQIPMIVATASPLHIVTDTLKRLNILSYFSEVLTCGDIGIGKDHPDIYLKAAFLMGSEPAETLVFEDALHAIRTATDAGFYVIGVYDHSEGVNEDKIKPLCNEYVKSFTELLDNDR